MKIQTDVKKTFKSIGIFEKTPIETLACVKSQNIALYMDRYRGPYK